MYLPTTTLFIVITEITASVDQQGSLPTENIIEFVLQMPEEVAEAPKISSAVESEVASLPSHRLQALKTGCGAWHSFSVVLIFRGMV